MNYQDPQIAAIYEMANPLAEDAEFYLSLAGPRSCTVLDLGRGTGTLSCALAERGHPAAAMLALARDKPHAERVEWVESSAQTYRSQRRFDLIVMNGHAFQVLLTDADTMAALETMYCHLRQCGRAAFDTRNARMDWVGEWRARTRMLSGGQITETLNITGTDGEFISFQTRYRLPERTVTTSSRLRFPSREHVEELITRSGLQIRALFGNWNSAPFEAQSSREIIFILAKAK